MFDFNTDVIDIYGIGRKEDEAFLRECRDFLCYTIEHLSTIKTTRSSEDALKNAEVNISFGTAKNLNAHSDMIRAAKYVICAGDWDKDPDAADQYGVAKRMSKTIFEMRYESDIPTSLITSYLDQVRPIEEEWDDEKMNPLLVLDCVYAFEVVDGHHRLELARKVGKETLPCWILRRI